MSASSLFGSLIPRLLVLLLLLLSAAQSASAICGGTTTVSDEYELDAAISAFNAVAAGPCVFTIAPVTDIRITGSNPPIDNSTAGVSLVIAGNGFRVYGSGSPDIRPFEVAVNTTVTINDLIVAEGRTTGTGFENRGGGILNYGTLTLNRTAVTHNSSENRGGGIANQGGILEINDSTISNNTSSVDFAGGGGIYSEDGSLTLRNTTVSGNDATGLNGIGGGIDSTSNMVFDSATIADNFAPGPGGSGLSYSTVVAVSLAIRNTIVADNLGSPDCFLGGAASVNDQGYNLTGSGNCGFVDGVNHNIVGSAHLFPLDDNGGPTPTHVPRLGSAALDNGDTTLPADQRGVARPSGTGDDIGAVESTLCADGTTFPVSDQAELNAAILCFNDKSAPDVYTIELTQGIPLAVSTPTIDNSTSGVSLVIDGKGMGADASQLIGVRPVDVAAGTTVTIQDMHLGGGELTGAETGATIRNAGNLTLLRLSLDSGIADQGTGGIANLGTMVVSESTLFNFTSTSGSGAAIDNATGATLTITNSTISGNTTTSGNGGGIASSGALTLASVTVHANSAAAGSGLYLDGAGPFTIDNTILGGNPGSTDCHLASGSITDLGHNLVQTQSGCGFTDGVNGDIVGQDPLLGPLRPNGGRTRTHLLLPGSPALDAGDTSLTFDQRGLIRPSGAADDVGAVEDAQLGQITVVKTTMPSDDMNFDFIFGGTTLPAPFPFQLDGALDLDGIPEMETFSFPAGTYEISESVTGVWGPDDITCVGGSATADLATASATVVLGVGDDVTCTFANVVTEADLSVTLVDSPDPVIAGNQLTYVATVSNAGPQVSRQVTLVVPRPLGTSIVSATPDGGGVCTVSGTGVECSWNSAVTRTVTIVLEVNSDLVSGSMIHSTATVSSAATPDPVSSNNSAAADTTVQAQSYLSATKIADFDPGPLTLSYQIDIGNAGPSDQPDNPGAEMIDPLPLGFTYIGSTATSGTLTYDGPSRTLEWSGSVMVGQVVSIIVDGTVDVAVAGATISNQAQLFFDSDGDGTNDGSAPSDDPTLPGTADPTIVALGSVTPIPTLGEWAMIALILLLGLLGAATLRHGL